MSFTKGGIFGSADFSDEPQKVVLLREGVSGVGGGRIGIHQVAWYTWPPRTPQTDSHGLEGKPGTDDPTDSPFALVA